MLTPSQKATLKTNIQSLTGAGLPAELYTNGNLAGIADYYNVVASPDFFVWRTDTPVQDIYDAIDWAKLTPSDAPGSGQAFANQSLACQGKQFNLQTMLMGQSLINGSKVNVRAGLQDALQNIPSGAGGSNQGANWTGVRAAIARKATRLEKLFANTSGGDGAAVATSATMVVEGALSYTELINL